MANKIWPLLLPLTALPILLAQLSILCSLTQATPAALQPITVTYPPTTAQFPNPERGFYHHTETHANSYEPLDLATLQSYRQNESITLILRLFYLDDFVDSDISQAYLAAMQDDFDTVRAAGLKVIVRLVYSNGSDPGPPYGDATKAQILRHIEQLQPIWQANSDVIAAVQAGFIGLWGEWWYSDYFQPDGDWDDRREVLLALLDTLPTTRMVQLRTPRYKYTIFSDTVVYSDTMPFPTPLTITQAHDGSYLARTGYHNDCTLSSADDYGTYVYTPTEYPYLEGDTNYVVMGGETCVPYFPGDSDPDRLKCQTALQELALFHWSYLNIDWYTPTLQTWRDGGCFTEIEQRLGYRFSLVQGTYDNQVSSGGDFHFSLQIKNEGFAAPFNPREVELILRHTNGSTYTFELPDDPRFWLPGETHTISHTVTLRSSMPSGSYALLLNLPAPEIGLRHRPEYAIRLANAIAWEADTGYNNLNQTLEVIFDSYLPFIFWSH